jgi:hypothetical protein
LSPKLSAADAAAVSLSWNRRQTAIERLGGVEVFCGAGGVVRVDGLAGRSVLIRVSLDPNDQLRILDLQITGSEPLRATDLREINVGALERLANMPEIATQIRSNLNAPGVSLRDAFDEFYGVDVISGLHEPELVLPVGQRKPVPKQMTRGHLTDRFLRSVARCYEAAVREGFSPAAVIQREASPSEDDPVPRTAVHWWVREARRRGLLGGQDPGRTESTYTLWLEFVGESSGRIPPMMWGERARDLAHGEKAEVYFELALDLLEDEVNWRPVPLQPKPARHRRRPPRSGSS